LTNSSQGNNQAVERVETNQEVNLDQESNSSSNTTAAPNQDLNVIVLNWNSAENELTLK